MNKFLWGVATSAYQLEGVPENDWTAWEARGAMKTAGVRCGHATGHRERWGSDLDLLPTIGANAYRYSVEWSRIEPRPGAFVESERRHQRDFAQHLADLGIEPVVTLHHYTHPSGSGSRAVGNHGRASSRFADSPKRSETRSPAWPGFG